jgi:hypothetical protein
MLRWCWFCRQKGSVWPTRFKKSHVKNRFCHRSSKLQTDIALSIAEAEYNALSSTLWEVIPLMTVMDEMKGVFPLLMETLHFFCKVWEDNQSCIAMATFQRITPRTKRIALKYHHFKHYFESGQISINYIHTERQQADVLTKPVRTDLFLKLRFMLMGS